ncbi:MAG TPA: hypothetical protein VKB78_07780 [Pirellulales bacterium]|nr:hypothetical protein [Pirellulales bacterium]
MAIEKYYLELAGEYRVCSELLKRSLFATITHGNMKGIDIFAIGDRRRTAVVEVKASNSNRFVTGLFQKYPDPTMTRPDFWVLYSIRETSERFDEQFFILSHDELAAIQARRNNGGREVSYGEAAARAKKRVDNVLIADVADYKDQWQKIIDFCQSPKRSRST